MVRSISTESHGTYLAVVNVGLTEKEEVTIRMPEGDDVSDVATGKPLKHRDGKLIVSMYPCQLRAVRVQ